MNNKITLYFHRIEDSEGIYINKTSASKGCILCYYWNFLDKRFKFQPDICNWCHDVLMISMNLSNIAIPIIYDVACHCIINTASKSEAMSLLNN